MGTEIDEWSYASIFFLNDVICLQLYIPRLLILLYPNGTWENICKAFEMDSDISSLYFMGFDPMIVAPLVCWNWSLVESEFWRENKDAHLHKQQHLFGNPHICFWYWRTFWPFSLTMRATSSNRYTKQLATSIMQTPTTSFHLQKGKNQK